MSNRAIKELSNFIFVEDTIQIADLIIIPGGSWPELLVLYS